MANERRRHANSDKHMIIERATRSCGTDILARELHARFIFRLPARFRVLFPIVKSVNLYFFQYADIHARCSGSDEFSALQENGQNEIRGEYSGGIIVYHCKRDNH